ncbi:MAG TPA: PEGA domain-containing protein [Vicinamibacterales bacterium]
MKHALLKSAFAIGAALASLPGLASAGQFVVYPQYPVQYVGPDSSVRLEVKPKEAEVFVDGYYAGIVDDFDGTFQRLRLPPGQHEITIYLSGYHTVRQHIFTTPDNTFKLKYQMEKLGPEDQPEPRPVPPPTPPQMGPPPQQGSPYPQYPPSGGSGRHRPQQAPPPQTQDPRGTAPPAGQPAFGTLAIRVQPLDADLLVDGQRSQGPQQNDSLLIELPEGRHTLEVRKAGFRTYVTEVDIHPGDTTTVNISLRSQGDR